MWIVTQAPPCGGAGGGQGLSANSLCLLLRFSVTLNFSEKKKKPTCKNETHVSGWLELGPHPHQLYLRMKMRGANCSLEPQNSQVPFQDTPESH